MCTAQWIIFKAVHKGRKQGCDVKLRTIQIFAPISIYNNPYLIWLRFLSCWVLVVFGVAGGALAVWISYYGIYYRLKPPLPKDDEERPPGMALSPNNIVLPSKEQTKQIAEISHKSAEEVREFIYRWIAAPSCAFFLVITVVLVEETIKSNNIDLIGSSMPSMSQLLPLLFTIFTGLSVVFHFIVEERNKKWRYREALKSFLDSLKTASAGTKMAQIKMGKAVKPKVRVRLPRLKREKIAITRLKVGKIRAVSVKTDVSAISCRGSFKQYYGAATQSNSNRPKY